MPVILKIIGFLFAFLLLDPLLAGEDDESYQVAPGDVLTIRVFGEPDLSFNEIPINPNGILSFPLIGDVEVAGLSTKTIEKEIERRLADGYLKKPIVTVSIKRFRNIYIRGEVKRPGAYPYEKGLTVEKAISMAGGLTPRASKSAITLKREKGQKEIDADMQTPLRPGDIVTIGQSFF
ncbi:polysaccharide biosynthesis/export protein VpsN [Methylomarinovum tepidoasis]|uniref:Polysaccharide biosynthesis/export protein VpsN n=1 Tax=Methylomarinovum tepidoasis TaxID=2840183 RepID=A0AAU9CAR7_9GAMM|nr:polysaccharide biosynthesis/export family protein [Methylomarinovum sp. IN45]BCX87751.1 polysaccharide biosynthesis/export protein VpsN [Methylomarinovum sp. IN45]